MKKLEFPEVTPFTAVSLCILVGFVAIYAVTQMEPAKGEIAVQGIGALGQVIIALMLYFIAREQFKHSLLRDNYKREEQKLSDLKISLAGMRKTHSAFNVAKTGITQTKCDQSQIQLLAALKVEMLHCFKQPVSSDFNKALDFAIEAAKIGLGNAKYEEKIKAFIDKKESVYLETRRQIEEMANKVESAQNKLDNIITSDNK